MSEIALRQDDQPMLPQAAAGLVEWARAAQAAHSLALSLVKTSFVPAAYKGKPEEATAAILAGSEIGLSPLAALRAFDHIQGIAAPKAITLRAIAQSHGHHLEIVEESDTRAVAEYKRKGAAGSMRTVEWTIERAQQMGLPGKNPNWKSNPRAMLVARVTAEAARRVASDAILGIAYSSEELLDEGRTNDSAHVVTEVPRRVTAAEILRRQSPVDDVRASGGQMQPAPTPDNPVVDVQDPPDGYDDRKWLGGEPA